MLCRARACRLVAVWGEIGRIMERKAQSGKGHRDPTRALAVMSARAPSRPAMPGKMARKTKQKMLESVFQVFEKERKITLLLLSTFNKKKRTLSVNEEVDELSLNSLKGKGKKKRIGKRISEADGMHDRRWRTVTRDGPLGLPRPAPPRLTFREQ